MFFFLSIVFRSRSRIDKVATFYNISPDVAREVSLVELSNLTILFTNGCCFESSAPRSSFTYIHVCIFANCYLEPILRLLNLQLHRQRCKRLERSQSKRKYFCFQNALGYPWRCTILQSFTNQSRKIGSWSQAYYRELQHQRCKNLQRHE
jgi:hypothetical protein